MPAAEKIVLDLLNEADVRVGGDRPQDIRVEDSRFYERVLGAGSLGLGESYMDGWWEANRLDVFFHHVVGARLAGRIRRPAPLLAALAARLFNQQSRKLSRRVAKSHYDLGNRFYADMLDPWMQYTCAYWPRAASLAEAQEHKLDLVCRKLGLQPGHEVLELGGGWGGFARFAAERYGCHVTLYNISGEQVAFAREFCRDLPVRIIERDYREAEGIYDRIVSIGLCEHVGLRNHRDFLALQRRHLRDDGLALLHTIGRNVSLATADPWFRKYIFPGGLIPSLRQLTTAAEGLFVIEDLHNIGTDYDRTLMAWYENFRKNWPRHNRQLGKRFERMWRYYLLSCAGAFRARSLQLWQFVLSPGGVPGGYDTVR